MLDGCHHNRREIEHLAPDLPGGRRVGKIIPTSIAVVRRVVDDLVGIGEGLDDLNRFDPAEYLRALLRKEGDE